MTEPNPNPNTSDHRQMASAVATLERVDVGITRTREWPEVRRTAKRLSPRAEVDGW